MNDFKENKNRSDEIFQLIHSNGYDKQVSEISVAIIDLKNPSEIFGTNLDLFLYPASVFKIFIGAEILRQIDIGKYSIEQELTVKPLHEIPKELKLYPEPRTMLKTGDKVSIDRLLYLMLAISDNTASNCLYELVGMESIVKNVIEPNGWSGTGFTPYFLDRLKAHKPYRHTDMIRTSAHHVAEFFALVEQEKILNPFVSRKLKEYMMKYDKTKKRGYSIPHFLQYHKSGYLETNLYIKGFGALIKSIFTKGWAFQRYMHDAGVVKGEKPHYVVVIFTLSKQFSSRKYFQMEKLAKDIFSYMENDSVV
jgi:beta-lactamase class A